MDLEFYLLIMINNKQKGFSLVELLIVIAVIVALSLISIFALNEQRIKARDAKRLSDIRQIRTALEFYYSDFQEYPITEQKISLGTARYKKLCSKQEGGFVPITTDCSQETTYIADIPADPAELRQYFYQGNADGYDLQFSTEHDTILGPAWTYHAHSQVIDYVEGNY